MTAKRYRVKLTAEAREELKARTTQGRVPARQHAHAHILLPCDEGRREDGGRTGCEIAEVLDVGVSTVARVHRRCVEERLEAALNRKEPLNRRAKSWMGRRPKLGWWRSPAASPGGLCALVVALARGSVDGVRDRGFREPVCRTLKNTLANHG